MKLPKYKPEHMIEELRDSAREDFDDLLPDIDHDLEEMFTWEAADMLERMHGALKQIADGTPDPQAIAKAALNPPEG
jgi:hypothetical protein